MTDDRSSLRSFLDDLKRRKVYRVGVVYAAVADTSPHFSALRADPRYQELHDRMNSPE